MAPRKTVPDQTGKKRKAAEVETGELPQKRRKDDIKAPRRSKDTAASEQRREGITSLEEPERISDTAINAATSAADPVTTTLIKSDQTPTLTEDKNAEAKKLRKEAKKARRRQAQEEKERHLAKTRIPPIAAEKRIVAKPAEEEGVPAGLKSKKKRRKQPVDEAKEFSESSAARPGDNAPVAKPTIRNRQSWTLTPRSAGRYIQHDPAFVRDGRGYGYLLASNGYELQVLSLETSIVERAKPAPEGCTIRCFSADSVDSNLVHIVYSDNRILTWDWDEDKDSEPPHACNGKPVATTTAATNEDERAVQYYVSDMGKHSAISCSAGRPGPLFVSKQYLHSVQAVGKSEYVVAHGPSVIVLGKRKDGVKEGFAWIELPFLSPVVCLDARLDVIPGTGKKAQQSSRLSLAIGNEEGQIHLYDDVSSLFALKEKPSLHSPRILHWHREAASSAKFSRDGNYLITGGKETVLVLWQLETGKKQFLPHLTSEIERIVVSPEGDRYAIQMGDNSIMVLSTGELKPVANFAGLQLPVSTDRKLKVVGKTAAILHPSHPYELLLTVPSTQPKSSGDISSRSFLQTFDVRTARHMSRQALTRNNVTDFNLGPERTPIVPPDVAHIAVSRDGQWLATVENWRPPASDVEFLATDEEGVQEERKKRSEVYFKFWYWDESRELWKLNTRVDAPHSRAVCGRQGAGNVFALLADPSTNGFATAGEDSCVKRWKPKTRRRQGVISKEKDVADVESVDWVCETVNDLERNIEDEDSDSGIDLSEASGPSGACLAYAEDGSMLAASMLYHGMDEAPLVHFISTLGDGGVVSRESLVAPDLISVGFLDRYFVALSSKAVRLWDMVRDQLQYHVKLPSPANEADEHMLALNRADGTFTVAMQKTTEGLVVVEVYGLQKNQPVHRQELGTPLTAMLASGAARGYMLLFVDTTIQTLIPSGIKQDLATLAIDEQAVSAADELVQPDVEVPDLTTLSVSTPKKNSCLTLEEVEDDRPVVRPEQLASVFDVGQSFAMPPVRDMLQAVVGLYSRKPRLRLPVDQDIS